jgi:KDO2-lipid IV(A) lauroyltransferase
MKYLVGSLSKVLAFLIHFMPLGFRNLLGDCIGILWFDILRVRRSIVLDNLKTAFPDLSLKEREFLGRKSLKNFGRGIVDYSHLPFINKNNYKQYIEVQNTHYVYEALKRGKGVCLLSLHLGNGDLGGAGLALSGMPIHLISKEFKLKWLNELWFTARARLGVKFIPPRNSTYSILGKLKANEVVIFVNDQFMGPPIGVKTTFFGKETGSAMGLSVIARRKKVPVIPVYCYRKENGQQVVSCDREIEFEEQSKKSETIRYMTQKYNDKIEQLIKKHPDQWMWVHRRWKEFKV